jgi:hypothetical protein
VRDQFLTAASMKMTVFWDAAPCSLVQTDLRSRGVHCLCHQNDHLSDQVKDDEKCGACGARGEMKNAYSRPDDRGSKRLWNVG